MALDREKLVGLYADAREKLPEEFRVRAEDISNWHLAQATTSHDDPPAHGPVASEDPDRLEPRRRPSPIPQPDQGGDPKVADVLPP